MVVSLKALEALATSMAGQGRKEYLASLLLASQLLDKNTWGEEGGRLELPLADEHIKHRSHSGMGKIMVT